MNRLIIIGNGFDLAHGLPTSYRNFIDDFWANFKEKCSSVEYQNIIYCNDNHSGYYLDYGIITNYKDFVSNIKEYIKEYSEFTFNEVDCICYKDVYKNNDIIFQFKNYFFKLINQKNSQNWVDIENEYYRMLKNCLKNNDESEIKKLNNEFEQVKNLLEKYLIEKVENNYVFSKYEVQDFISLFEDKEYTDKTLDRFFMEISTQTKTMLRNEHEKVVEAHRKDNGYNSQVEAPKHEIKLNNYFLSFNYTSTVERYALQLGLKPEQIIEIHGRLRNKNNLINFGFGDEMDRQYQEIEERDNNEYLRNIKSFQYLHSSNYKRLLDLIDADQFQVCVMGHSCGLSDRTLLNTIFEHENCCSIKVFYHDRKDGSDNYTEITQNISRHFNKKKLMRDKVVNKTLCQPLPQTKL